MDSTAASRFGGTEWRKTRTESPFTSAATRTMRTESLSAAAE